MITQTFHSVGHVKAVKNVTCNGGCGKRLRRQRTFSQTVNPYNRNDAGRMKDAAEILAENKVRAEEWKARPEICDDCRFGRTSP